MAIRYGKNKRTISVILKVVVAGICGIAAGVAIAALGHSKLAPLIGWNTAALVYVAWTWLTIWPMSAETTQHFSLREDPSRAISDVIVLGASVVSLVAVGVVLFASSNSSGELEKFLQAAISVFSVIVSWFVVHSIFTLRYAELYYTEPTGGIDFGDTKQPSYKDFAYVAFTLGMTFQVSDTNLTRSKIRQTALRHALISYLFGTIILASTINLVAGLTK